MAPVCRRVLLFFLLSCPLSWFGLLGNFLLPSDLWPVPMNPFGPLVAAVIVVWATDGRAGVGRWLRRIARFRARPWVYAVAFFIPLAIILASVGFAVAAGVPAGPLPAYGPLEILLLLPVVLLLGGPAAEEPAFRGLAQHELQAAISPLAASLWVGLGVLIWHLPVLLLQYVPWPIAIALPAVSVVYAWLYRASGSVWPAVLLHFVQNAAGAGYFGRIFAPDDGAVWVGILAAFYVAWAAILAWRLGPSLRPEPRSSLARPPVPVEIKKQPSPAPDRPWLCPTCDRPVATAFCPGCGELPMNPRDLTLRGLTVNFTAMFTSVNGRVLNTIRSLIRRPGSLTLAFQRGQRKPYIGAVRLFVLANILFFAVQSPAGVHVFGRPLATQIEDGPGSALMHELLDQHVAAASTTVESYAPVFDQAVETNSKSLIGLMVLPFALCVPLIAWREARPFAVHVVFSLHFFAFLLLLLCLPASALAIETLLGGTMLRTPLADAVISLLLLSACAVYLHLAIHKVYDAHGLRRSVQTVLLLVAFLACVAAYRVALFPITLFTT